MGFRTKGSGGSTTDLRPLVEALRSGEEGASLVVRQRVRKILAFRGFGIGYEERLDLEQIVMTQVWEAVSQPDFEVSRFWGFVEIVASRRCIDWIRSHKPVSALESVPTPREERSDPLQSLLTRERRQLVRAVLGRLPADCRRLILMRFGEGRSYAQIGETMGRSEGALRVRMHRCIRQAAQWLGKHFREGDET